MTDILYDMPYNMFEQETAFPRRLRHFYFVIPSFNSDEETVEDEVLILKQLQAALPQWGVLHIITREALYGASQPIFTEDYAVTYYTMDVPGARTAVTTMLSAFSFSALTYDMVSV